MAKLSKLTKVSTVASVTWFLVVIWMVDRNVGWIQSELFGDRPGSFNFDTIPVFLILNAPLIIGWVIWWIKRD